VGGAATGGPGTRFERSTSRGLRGRRRECAALASLLDGVRQGRSAVLVLRGEAGVGKSALLDVAAESAADLTLVRAAGVESEMALAFEALHQLCGPMLDRLERLPRPRCQGTGQWVHGRDRAGPHATVRRRPSAADREDTRSWT